MAYGRRSLAAALVVTLLAACGGKKIPATRFVVAGRATMPDFRCVPVGTGSQNDEHLSNDKIGTAQIATLRLSLRTHASAGDMGQFGCDVVVRVPSEAPDVRLPSMGPPPQTIDIYAEAFGASVGGAAPPRLAYGALLDVPANTAKLADVRLYPVNQFRCAAPTLSRPRAFHSATKLPNHQVLIIGGLVSGTAGSDTIGLGGLMPLNATAEVEVYDPLSGTFKNVIDKTGTPAIPRAFHQATLVDANGPPYTLLVVGGVSTPDPTAPVLGLNNGAAPGTRLVPFDASGSFLVALKTRAATTAELVKYDPGSNPPSLTRMPVPGFAAAAFQAGAPFSDGIAVAGGIDWGDPLEMETPSTQVAVTRGGEMPRKGTLGAPRLGATLTRLNDTNDSMALLWGGAIVPTDPIGELITGLAAKGTVTSMPLALMGQTATQFHTATLLDSDVKAATRTLLTTGGFVETTTSMGSALEPDLGAYPHLVTVTLATGATTVTNATLGDGYDAKTDPSCTSDKRYRAAGWEAAVPIGRGRILISGGAPTYLTTPPCDDCNGGSGLLCATRQASIFTPPMTVSAVAEGLQVARFGHAATLLDDGNVLITGGIGAGGGAARLIGDVEEYNPRAATAMQPDPDDPLAADLMNKYVRAPGQVATAIGSTTPARPCGEL
jgi:hypothetical protein